MIIAFLFLCFTQSSAVNFTSMEECEQDYSNLTIMYNELESLYNACGCEVNPCAITENTAYDKGLHIAGVFIILVASGLGAALPIGAKYLRFLGVDPYYICLGKCMGSGVVLACGLVHMLQPSSASLTSPCVPWEFNTDYNAYAFLYAMLAGLFMQFVDFLFSQYFLMKQRRINKKKGGEGNDLELAATKPSTAEGHSHSSLLELDEIDWSTKKLIEAYMIEFGVTTHSLFVGLTVGVVDYDTLKVLLVALVFHQFSEGVALGSRIADANISHANELLLSTIFSLAAPIGIGVGIAAWQSMNTNGETFLMVQGTFDGICGGILIYIGYSLILIDFPRDLLQHCHGKPHEKLKQAGMFIFLWLGAGIMAFIGKYL